MAARAQVWEEELLVRFLPGRLNGRSWFAAATARPASAQAVGSGLIPTMRVWDRRVWEISSCGWRTR
jgi:hypothetical protein